MALGQLILHRSPGAEVFALASASWWTTPEAGGIVLWLRVTTESEPLLTQPDTVELHGRPSAELGILRPGFDLDALVGQRFQVAEAYCEVLNAHIATLAYCADQELSENDVVILARQGSRLHIRWTARTTDVNFYDGGTPDTRVEIEAWFGLRAE
jgi:hypothetical protein